MSIQQGDIASAVALYDNTIGPMAIKDGGNFPLSDASALLMRLNLHGVNVEDRSKELLPYWEKHNEDFVSLFYDGHNCFNTLLSGDNVATSKLMDNMRDYINDNRAGWNKDVVTKMGLELLEGIQEYFNGDYNRSVDLLSKVMPELQNSIQGSWAQKDIFRQILLDACIKSGSATNLSMARQILDQKLVYQNIKTHAPANQRVLEKILTMA